MKNFKLFAAVALSACFAMANAQSVLSVSVSKNSTGTRVYADVNLANEGSINTLTFDLLYPEGLSYNSSSVSKGGLCSLYDEDEDTYTDLWTIDDQNFANGRAVRLATKAKTGKDIPAGQTGKVFRVSFVPENSSVEYSPSDFYFNNFAAALGGIREELKAPLCVLGTNGYSSFGSSSCMVIEGATAYYGEISGDVLQLSAVDADKAVRNGNGVVLNGTQGTVVYGTSVVVEKAQDPVKNDIVACPTGATVSNVHVLATKNGVTGFYKYSGTNITAGKAYLEGASGARISFENEAGIENVELNNVEAIFNLQGQKMTEAKKGINIVNGKKVMY